MNRKGNRHQAVAMNGRGDPTSAFGGFFFKAGEDQRNTIRDIREKAILLSACTKNDKYSVLGKLQTDATEENFEMTKKFTNCIGSQNRSRLTTHRRRRILK